VQEKINILLVDDQPAKLLSYRAILAELGENLRSAASPREALDILLRTEIAVILMDVQMPDLDGFELASMIRAHPRFEKTAIIFVSAIRLSDLDQLKGYAAGAVDYVSVPIIPEVLRAKVRVFAELWRKTRQLEQLNEELERRVDERTAELETSTQHLKDSEQRRSIALAAGSMGSWDWDPVTKEQIWDEGQFRICGLDPVLFRPTTESVTALLHPDDRGSVCSAARMSFESGQRFQAEFRILRPDGNVRWCVATGITSQDARGQSRLMSGVTYDITERKLVEQALELANEDLERRIDERTRERETAMAQLFEAQKTEMIGQLTGGVAHDFNNLLMAVLGSLELLGKRLNDDKSIRLLSNAIAGAQRGVALTQRLLAFARRQELQPAAVDVAALVHGIDDLLQRALGPAVRLVKSLPDALPAIEIDANQLELALLNLAVNARDAMPDGGTLTISAELVRARENGSRELAPGDYLCLSLIDTGNGMDEVTLAKATEPFFTTKGPGKGTGLGLSMVQGMAAQSGGALELASAKGVGTKVRLLLPLASNRVSVSSADDACAAPPPESSTPQLTVLIVDDDSLVRTGTAAMLEDLGHHVIEAESGAEALRLLTKRSDVDLVVTDFAMPEMSGIDLVRRIAKDYPHLRTIFASGYAETSWEDVDASSIRLPKPFNQVELAAAITQALMEPRRRLGSTKRFARTREF
jgi:signal transduction histidine kinase/response regulator RpfG family c-di-GMP phosphodiesterase